MFRNPLEDSRMLCGGLLAFVTANECRDVAEATAKEFILGFTCAIELSCHLNKISDGSSGLWEYYHSRQVASIGPLLTHTAIIDNSDRLRMTTKVNGTIVQDVDIKAVQNFSPERILSWASQRTTIPAGAVFLVDMLPGAGNLFETRQSLDDGDLVEVEIDQIGILQSKVAFR